MAIQGIQTQNQSGEKKSYEPIPDDSYTVSLNRIREKSTKAGNGTLIDVSFQVTDGDFKNRLVWDSFLISHPNAKAAGIGLQRLDSMLKSMGVHGGFEALGNDSSQLEQFVGKEFIINTAVENNPGYKPRNVVKKYSRK
tara:strand:+ start:2052 stop:2468 length:417 start_codon:yes stop_codon:yes gene_type:complete